MYIIDYFRKISSLDAYREIEEVIRSNFMRFKFKRDDNNNYKAFFLPGFANDEPFVYIKFLPYNGENIPCSIDIYQHVTICYGPKGINCNPVNKIEFPLHKEQFRLSDWKEAKKNLLAAIAFATDSLYKTDNALEIWKEEKQDPKTIVLEHTGNPPPQKKNRYKRRTPRVANEPKLTVSNNDVSPVDYQGAKLP